MKIIKSVPRSWAGTGFGYRPASYFVFGRIDIRILRESHGWTAYTPAGKLFDTTKRGLEQQLSDLEEQTA
jgi:hypothetical protein